MTVTSRSPTDTFAKRVSIKHDLAARQLSPQDRIVSAAEVDPVRQPPPALPADGGRDVKAWLRWRVIAARNVLGRSSELPQTDAAWNAAAPGGERASLTSAEVLLPSGGGWGWWGGRRHLLTRPSGAGLLRHNGPTRLAERAGVDPAGGATNDPLNQAPARRPRDAFRPAPSSENRQTEKEQHPPSPAPLGASGAAQQPHFCPAAWMLGAAVGAGLIAL